MTEPYNLYSAPSGHSDGPPHLTKTVIKYSLPKVGEQCVVLWKVAADTATGRPAFAFGNISRSFTKAIGEVEPQSHSIVTDPRSFDPRKHANLELSLLREGDALVFYTGETDHNGRPKIEGFIREPLNEASKALGEDDRGRLISISGYVDGDNFFGHARRNDDAVARSRSEVARLVAA